MPDIAPPARPFPPGDYPVVVVGSGPGGLQVSYSLRHHRVPHALISADAGPGGMFRKWPVFQRLLSWTKLHAEGGPGSRGFERSDWNSLLAEEPDARALQARHMDGSSPYPSRPEMEANLADFAARTRLDVRYECRWEGTRRLNGEPGGMRFALATSDGEYRCRHAIFAVGVAEPWNPSVPGIEHAHHYADTSEAQGYAGRRVLILGKANSGFEIASALLGHARSIVLVSPSPAQLSVVINSLVGVRARYLLPFEDFVLGGGVAVMDGTPERIEPRDNGLELTLRRPDGNEARIFADDIISATGFRCPLGDLATLGVATFGASNLPAQTRWWESATLPGIHFAGTINQGVRGLARFGIPPNSGAVQGYRYNARLLARRLAETQFGNKRDRPALDPAAVVSLLLDEATRGPELWHQKGFLARAITVTADEGVRDQGIVPLTAFLDEETRDGVALALEADGSSAIYPVAFVRRGGRLSEIMLPPEPLLRFEGQGHARLLAAALSPLGLG